MQCCARQSTDVRTDEPLTKNLCKALRNIIAKSPPSLPEEEAKASIVDKINEFINTRITLAANEIAKNAITKIRDGDVILTYGRCVVSLLGTALGLLPQNKGEDGSTLVKRNAASAEKSGCGIFHHHYIRHLPSLVLRSRSSLVESVLVAAQQAKRGSFRVIIVDSRPGVEGRQLSETLSAEGIPCTYVLLTAISYIMRVSTDNLSPA